MHFHKLDLNLLVALDTLLEERSVSRAADRLNLSQSALSSSLSRLREYFGDHLLIPAGRRMEPTALGLSLESPVRDILQRVRAAIETRPTFDPATAQRRFRIITSDYLIEVLLADVVRELARIAPGIQLQILPSNEISFALFLRGDVDLVIAPDTHTVEDHPRSLLFEETFSCVVWTGNTTAREPLTTEQWLGMSHVVVHLGHGELSLLEKWLAEHSITKKAERRVDIIAPSFSSASVGRTRGVLRTQRASDAGGVRASARLRARW